MDVVFAGRLSHEVPMKDVIEQVLERALPGRCILRIDTDQPDFSGKLLLMDSRYIVAARCTQGPSGYEAMRRLLSVTSGQYALLQVQPIEKAGMISDLNISLLRVHDVIPAFPENPDDLFDERSLLDKVFFQSRSRMPASDAGPGHGGNGTILAGQTMPQPAASLSPQAFFPQATVPSAPLPSVGGEFQRAATPQASVPAITQPAQPVTPQESPVRADEAQPTGRTRSSKKDSAESPLNPFAQPTPVPFVPTEERNAGVSQNELAAFLDNDAEPSVKGALAAIRRANVTGSHGAAKPRPAVDAMPPLPPKLVQQQHPDPFSSPTPQNSWNATSPQPPVPFIFDDQRLPQEAPDLPLPPEGAFVTEALSEPAAPMPSERPFTSDAMDGIGNAASGAAFPSVPAMSMDKPFAPDVPSATASSMESGLGAPVLPMSMDKPFVPDVPNAPASSMERSLGEPVLAMPTSAAISAVPAESHAPLPSFLPDELPFASVVANAIDEPPVNQPAPTLSALKEQPTFMSDMLDAIGRSLSEAPLPPVCAAHLEPGFEAAMLDAIGKSLANAPVSAVPPVPENPLPPTEFAAHPGQPPIPGAFAPLGAVQPPQIGNFSQPPRANEVDEDKSEKSSAEALTALTLTGEAPAPAVAKALDLKAVEKAPNKPVADTGKGIQSQTSNGKAAAKEKKKSPTGIFESAKAAMRATISGIAARRSDDESARKKNDYAADNKFVTIDAEFIREQAILKAKPQPRMASVKPMYGSWDSPKVRIGLFLAICVSIVVGVTYWKDIQKFFNPPPPPKPQRQALDEQTPAKPAETARPHKGGRRLHSAAGKNRAVVPASSVHAQAKPVVLAPAHSQVKPKVSNAQASTVAHSQTKSTDKANGISATPPPAHSEESQPAGPHRHAYSSNDF